MIETNTAKVWLREDGILQLEVIDILDSIEQAKENVAAIAQVGQGKRRPCLVNLSGAKKIGRDERSYFASENTAKAVSAVALVIDSPLTRILGNFFKGLNKPVYPLQLFTSEANAIRWLKGFIE